MAGAVPFLAPKYNPKNLLQFREERDIDFTAPMYVKSGFQIITEDMIPEI